MCVRRDTMRLSWCFKRHQASLGTMLARQINCMNQGARSEMASSAEPRKKSSQSSNPTPEESGEEDTKPPLTPHKTIKRRLIRPKPSAESHSASLASASLASSHIITDAGMSISGLAHAAQDHVAVRMYRG